MEQYSKREHSRSFRKRQNTQACVAVDAGIDISAGVEGSIGPLKDEDNIPILTQSFELFQVSRLFLDVFFFIICCFAL